MSKNDVLIGKIQELVESTCKRESNIFGYGAWSHHITGVVKYSKLLSHTLNVNTEIVEIAALLHDYAGIKDQNLYEDHHIHSAEIAQEILTKLNYPQENISLIKECIFCHRGSKDISRYSVEAQILASADAMAHFDNVDSLLYLAYTKHKMDIDQGTQWVLDKLERSWQKLLPEAKEILLEKYLAIKTTFNRSMII